ncbi:MAG TPA: pyrroline-5-carboxylate reductase [bacterium]|nr:pyrroline-5-carboxylate reductase [bacterium]
MNLGIIGCGNMATAILRGIVNSKIIENLNIVIYDIIYQKSKELSALHQNIKSTQNIKELFNSSEFILLAVKPQNFNDLFKTCAQYLDKTHILISIAAGISINKIQNLISANSHKKLDLQICRIMPNLPSFIFKGLSGIYFSKNFNQDYAEQIKKIFSAIGKIIILETEEKINDITAISGSGPAYLYYFIECFIAAAKNLGFDETAAKELVYATISGAFEYLEKSEQSPKELRRCVTSPGGTTEAAINHLQSQNFENIISAAILKARDRAKELGK